MRWKSVRGTGLKFSITFFLVWLTSVEEVAAFATLAGRGCIVNTQVKMCACIYICLNTVYTHINECMHVCILYIYMYVYIYIFMCMYIYIYIHARIYIYLYVLCIYTRMYIYTYVMKTYILHTWREIMEPGSTRHTYIFIDLYVYIHTNICVHTCTNMIKKHMVHYRKFKCRRYGRQGYPSCVYTYIYK